MHDRDDNGGGGSKGDDKWGENGQIENEKKNLEEECI